MFKASAQLPSTLSGEKFTHRSRNSGAYAFFSNSLASLLLGCATSNGFATSGLLASAAAAIRRADLHLRCFEEIVRCLVTAFLLGLR